ncbi:MAG: hypothetical protein V4669_08510 [Pseudomonadota bacterium]
MSAAPAVSLTLQKFETTALRLAWGPLTLEIAQVVLHNAAVTVRMEEGQPHIVGLEAASADLSGVKIEMLAGQPPQAANATPAGSSWDLGMLATAEGTIRAEIIDAHLMFDADVTVPIRYGQIDFDHATVEHVGPDSRMGISPQGIYVDAPNGRSYVYEFTSSTVAGVEFEKRAALLGPLVSDRGKLQLQAFAQGLLGAATEAGGAGLTGHARALLARTSIDSEVQLGDGTFAAPGVRADFVGRAQGRNAIRIHSRAVGLGVTLQAESLSLANLKVATR